MKFIYNKWFKTIFPIISSVAIAVFTGIIGSEISGKQTWSSSRVLQTSIVVVAVLLTFDICLAIFYFKREEDLDEKQTQINEKNNIIDQKEKDLKYLLEAFDSLGNEFMRSSEKMYQVITNAKLNGEIRLDAWSKNEIFSFVCDSLHDYICKVAEKGNDFSVSIIVRNKKNRKCHYLMEARSVNSKGTPNMYNVAVSEKKAKDYYYCKMFKNDNPEPSFLNQEEIKEKFYFNENTNRSKYSQYIGIPVCCSKKSENKMFALLQIISHKESIIFNDPDKIRSFIYDIANVYVNFIVLADKIEKAFLTVSMEDQEKEEALPKETKTTLSKHVKGENNAKEKK